MSIELLTLNHCDFICDAFQNAKTSVRIISPFIQWNTANLLIETAKNNPGIECTLITRFHREDFIQSASSLDALQNLVDVRVRIYVIQDLHTKLYLFDNNSAVVGSANFTSGGLMRNVELSLALRDEPDISVKLRKYYSDLLSQCVAQGDFLLTNAQIEKERELVIKSNSSRNKASTGNIAKWGAKFAPANPMFEIGDPVEQVIAAADTENATDVLKFEWHGNDRFPPKDTFRPNYYHYGAFYFVSASRRMRMITKDKSLFVTVLSYDSNGNPAPMIVGRAKTEGFEEKKYYR